MSTTMLRTSCTISAPTLQRFNAVTPAGERSRVVEQLLIQALCYQLRKVDKTRVVKPVGELDANDMAAIETAVKLVYGLN